MDQMKTLPRDGVLRFGTFVLNALRIANLLCIPLFLGMFVWLLFAPDLIFASFARKYGPEDARQILTLSQIAIFGGLCMIYPVHLILTRLLDMIQSIKLRNVFTLDNVRKLKSIAWALLATQLIDVCYGMATLIFPNKDVPMFDWQPSITAWLCVLMLFILARVFDHGVQLQDDLEGTV